jgi:hypothetical protein
LRKASFREPPNDQVSQVAPFELGKLIGDILAGQTVSLPRAGILLPHHRAAVGLWSLGGESYNELSFGISDALRYAARRPFGGLASGSWRLPSASAGRRATPRMPVRASLLSISLAMDLAPVPGTCGTIGLARCTAMMNVIRAVALFLPWLRFGCPIRRPVDKRTSRRNQPSATSESYCRRTRGREGILSLACLKSGAVQLRKRFDLGSSDDGRQAR